MIFTIVIDFNDPNDVAFLDKIQAVFQSYDQEVLFVELETDVNERLKRNRTENRLKHKPLNATSSGQNKIFNPRWHMLFLIQKNHPKRSRITKNQ